MKYGSIDDTQIPEHQMGNRQPYKAGIETDHAIGQHTFLVCRIPAEQQLASVNRQYLNPDGDTDSQNAVVHKAIGQCDPTHKGRYDITGENRINQKI